MAIRIELNGTKGEFRLFENEVQAGFMRFSIDENILKIEHTEVDQAYEGKGFGKQLVMAGVEYARERHLKIKPYCVYAKSVLERKRDEVGDVLL
ncbi:MAG: N-acetyltransferase [Sphingobacteriales bacterium]|jgi:predicted GNAT family acetyltransferase|nr:N-acetyltransferase [Sphingobacteriales bacterium]